jgi:2-dehydropantoate 2-reductase
MTLAARNRLERLDVHTPQGDMSVQPLVLTDPALAKPADWVLIATKAYDVVGASHWLEHSCNSDTLVAVLQNGVEHVARFAPYLPAEQIVPVMVDCPAERIRPGVIRQRGPARMVVPRGGPGAAFMDLFANTRIVVTDSPDFRTEVWKKLCYNSVGALSAILLKGAAIARHEGVVQIMYGIVHECIAVGRAEGARLADRFAAGGAGVGTRRSRHSRHPLGGSCEANYTLFVQRDCAGGARVLHKRANTCLAASGPKRVPQPLSRAGRDQHDVLCW